MSLIIIPFFTRQLSEREREKRLFFCPSSCVQQVKIFVFFCGEEEEESSSVGGEGVRGFFFLLCVYGVLYMVAVDCLWERFFGFMGVSVSWGLGCVVSVFGGISRNGGDG